MPRQLSEILNHIRSVCANPSVDATLIQTEDLLELCKQAEKSTVEAPADVREVAEKLLEDWRHDLPNSFNDLVAAVAAALTAQRAAGVEAERERCVRAADEIRLGWFNGDATTAYGQAYQQACRDVAASIRPDDGEGTK